METVTVKLKKSTKKHLKEVTFVLPLAAKTSILISIYCSLSVF